MSKKQRIHIIGLTISKRFILCFIASVCLVSCSKKLSISNYYKGITNNPKVIKEGLRLNYDNSYSLTFSIYDVGQYGSNIEYIGRYEIKHDKIRFSLDTIKSFSTRVYKPNERRDNNPFSNHKVTIVSSEQKEAFASGGYRLKSQYSIDSQREVIKDRLLERFINLEAAKQ